MDYKTLWQDRSRDVHARFVSIAQSKGELHSEKEIVRFLALAICGEAGELANLIKKSWRGDSFDLEKISDEIADVRIYLEHLARHLEIDLDEACNRKLQTVLERLAMKEHVDLPRGDCCKVSGQAIEFTARQVTDSTIVPVDAGR